MINQKVVRNLSIWLIFLLVLFILHTRWISSVTLLNIGMWKYVDLVMEKDISLKPQNFNSVLNIIEYSAEVVSDNPNVYRNLGYLNMADKELENAERMFRKALKLNPNDKLTNYYLGEVLYKKEQYDLAVKRWSKAGIRYYFYHQDDFHKSELILNYWLKKDPNGFSSHDYLFLGDSLSKGLREEMRYKKWIQKKYIKEIDWDETIFGYSKSREVNSSNVEAYEGLAFSYYWGKNNLVIASDYLEKALRKTDSEVNIYWWLLELGEWYRQSNEPEKAMRYFTNAMNINPNHEEAHIRMGLLQLIQLNDYSKAIQEFKLAKNKAPKSPYPYIYLGEAYIKDNQTEKAIGTYQKLVDLYPESRRYEKLLSEAKMEY